jgi:hypothetical protein
MEDREVGITKLLRRGAHLRIGDNGRPATGAELGTVAGREGIEGYGSAERGQQRGKEREADFHAACEVVFHLGESRREYKALGTITWR